MDKCVDVSEREEMSVGCLISCQVINLEWEVIEYVTLVSELSERVERGINNKGWPSRNASLGFRDSCLAQILETPSSRIPVI